MGVVIYNPGSEPQLSILILTESPPKPQYFEPWRDTYMYLVTSLDPLSRINIGFLHTTLAIFGGADNVWTAG